MKNIEAAGVDVVVYEQADETAYDSIFPDWFTMQRGDSIPGGVLTVFPMRFPSRRRERDDKIIEELKKSCKHFIDLRGLEAKDQFLEGKGSVIYDHKNNKIYCCNSERASLSAIEKYIEELNKISTKPWRAVVFRGADQEGKVIYHTDCMLQLLDKRALVCAPALSKEELARVTQELTSPSLNDSPYTLIELSHEEVSHMCCNIFNVINDKSENVLLMSKQAADSYTAEHKKLLEANYRIVASDVYTIERTGGGSTRCLLAEYF